MNKDPVSYLCEISSLKNTVGAKNVWLYFYGQLYIEVNEDNLYWLLLHSKTTTDSHGLENNKKQKWCHIFPPILESYQEIKTGSNPNDIQKGVTMLLFH